MSELKFKEGDRVHYHPVIGGPADGKIYEVHATGEGAGGAYVWLKGRIGFFAIEAISLALEAQPTEEGISMIDTTQFNELLAQMATSTGNPVHAGIVEGARALVEERDKLAELLANAQWCIEVGYKVAGTSQLLSEMRSIIGPTSATKPDGPARMAQATREAEDKIRFAAIEECALMVDAEANEVGSLSLDGANLVTVWLECAARNIRALNLSVTPCHYCDKAAEWAVSEVSSDPSLAVTIIGPDSICSDHLANRMGHRDRYTESFRVVAL